MDPDHDGQLGVRLQRGRPHVDEEAVLLAHHLPVARQRPHLRTHAAEAARVGYLAPAQRFGRRGPTQVTDGRSSVGDALKGEGSILLQNKETLNQPHTHLLNCFQPAEAY